jgi:hypothetical protein
MNNIVPIHGDINDEDNEFSQFLDAMKENLVKGAFIAFDKNGEVYCSSNVYNKAEQIVLIYKLKAILEDITNVFTPDDIIEVEDVEDE